MLLKVCTGYVHTREPIQLFAFVAATAAPLDASIADTPAGVSLKWMVRELSSVSNLFLVERVLRRRTSELHA